MNKWVDFLTKKATATDVNELKKKCQKLSSNVDSFMKQSPLELAKTSAKFVANTTKMAYSHGVVPTTKYFALPVLQKFIIPFAKMSAKTPIGKTVGFGVGVYTVGRISYVYGTGFNKNTIITKSMNQLGEKDMDGKNEYIVSDIDGHIYKIRNCPLRLQFRSPELFMKIAMDKEYNIRGYGWRIPAIGVFPNITRATLLQEEKKKKC